MARTRLSAVGDTLRSGLEDAQGRATDIAQVIAERVGDAIDTAGEEGRRVSKQLGQDLSRRWKVFDRSSRENPYYLALGALAVGVAVGYLLTRDRKRGRTDENSGADEVGGATEMGL